MENAQAGERVQAGKSVGGEGRCETREKRACRKRRAGRGARERRREKKACGKEGTRGRGREERGRAGRGRTGKEARKEGKGKRQQGTGHLRRKTAAQKEKEQLGKEKEQLGRKSRAADTPEEEGLKIKKFGAAGNWVRAEPKRKKGHKKRKPGIGLSPNSTVSSPT
ncbi:hypothetical protein [Alistipes sp.]|uniref:hypothetical protein n=1 Tax=Alistipes sp. TaxID=1872444 RepID=UPI0031FC7D27